MSEPLGPEPLVDACRFLAGLGLATSTSGNLSCRCGADVYVTPTGVSLRDVSPTSLSRTDLAGDLLSGPGPTKELALHLAVYRTRPDAGAVVHVHATHALAVSTLLQAGDCLPAVTPQFVMRAGRVPVLPYAPPGSATLAEWLADADARKAACLQNHGLLTFGPDFRHALGTLEELEENCRLWLLARGRGRTLDETQIEELLNRTM